MFSQKSGIEQSIASTIIAVVIQFVTQQLAGGLSGGARGQGGIGNIMSVLTNLGGNLNGDHPLVKQVQEKTSIQDPQQIIQYTHKAVDFIKEEAGANPQGIESLVGNVLGNIGGDEGQQVKKGLGGLLKGLFGSKGK